MSTVYVGVDPGFNGGIAFIGPDEMAVHPMPVTDGAKREYLEGELMMLIFSARELGGPGCKIAVAVEKQQAMPKQGVSSTFQTGEGYGLIRGICAGLGLPYVLMRPQEWRSSVGLPAKADKAASVALAQRMFPEVAELLSGPRGGLRDGLAESLLIAEARRRIG